MTDQVSQLLKLLIDRKINKLNKRFQVSKVGFTQVLQKTQTFIDDNHLENIFTVCKKHKPNIDPSDIFDLF